MGRSVGMTRARRRAELDTDTPALSCSTGEKSQRPAVILGEGFVLAVFLCGGGLKQRDTSSAMNAMRS